MYLSTAVYRVDLSDEYLTVFVPSADGYLLHREWVTNHHSNADYELHVILKGTVDITVEGERYSLKNGSALLIAPEKYHEPHVVTDEILRVSMSFLPPEGSLKKALCEAVETAICFSPSAELIRYTELLVDENRRKAPLRESAEQSLVSLLIVSLFRDLSLAKHVERVTTNRAMLERTQLIDNFFAFHYSEKAGCTALAKELHVCTKQLGRILKKHYGMSFREKLTLTRIDNAALLLRTTDMNVTDVIELVGYTSYTAFYKAFVARFGISPQKYQSAQKARGQE